MSSQIERVLFALLVRGESERFELAPSAEGAFRRALRVVLAGPDADRELYRAMQLAVAFETDLGSPQVAAQLRRWVGAEPDALARLRKSFLKSGAIDEARGFVRSEGREVLVRAPRVPLPRKVSSEIAFEEDAQGQLIPLARRDQRVRS